MVDASRKVIKPAAPTAYRPQPVPRVLQTKSALASRSPVSEQAHRAPLAPTVSPARPQLHAAQQRTAQPKHTALQPKMNTARTASPTMSRPQPALTVVQPKVSGVQSGALKNFSRPTGAAIFRPALKRVVQPFRSGVVQAVKFYPNLHPGAAVPVDRSNIFRLDSFADQYRLHRVNSHAVNVPNQKYNFVRTREGSTLLHNRYRHPSLAEGQQVLYAGEVFFNNGKLEWWSNGSGHYQPDADGAEQANLPLDYFYSYQQILKGEHTRK